MSGWIDCCRRCRSMCACGATRGGRARGSDEKASGGACELCAACKARMTRCARAAGLLAAAGAAYAALARPRMLRWGATAAEAAGALPGDELIPGARYQSTRAITIAAPAAEVWPWLVQMGQGKGGLYTYDALENLMRLNIHSADRVVPEWQSAVVGVDKVDLAPDGSMPMTLTICEPERVFVIRTGAPGEPPVAPGSFFRGEIAGSWAFILAPIDEATTRLIVRFRADWRQSLAGRVARYKLLEPMHFVMERGMLRGIKRRAEKAGGVGQPVG